MQQSQYLDVGCVDLSQEDLLRLQTAQFTQLFLQPSVLLIHIQPQAITHRSGTVQFNDYKHTTTLHMVQVWLFKCPPEIHDHSLSSSLLTSDLQMHGAVHGQGQRQEVEGVEASTDVSACLTLHLGSELAMKQIHNDGAVPAQVVVPSLCTKRDEFTPLILTYRQQTEH